MKKLFVILIAIILIIPTVIYADEPLVGVMEFDLENEINAETDLLGYLLEKGGTNREESHITRDFIDSSIKRSAGGIVSPHFIECWEDPYYLPRWTKRVTGSLRRLKAKPNSMFDFFLSSQVRTGYLTVWYGPYIPKMEADEEKPLEKALEEIYTEEWINCYKLNYNITIDLNMMIAYSNGKIFDISNEVLTDDQMLSLNMAKKLFSNTQFAINKENGVIIITQKIGNNILNELKLYINKKTYLINGQPATTETPPVIEDGRIFVPVHLVGEVIGGEITINGDLTRIVKSINHFEDIRKKNLDAIKDIDNIKLQKLLARYLLQMKRTGKYRDFALRKLPKDRYQDVFNTGRYNHLSSKDFDDEEFVKHYEEIMPEDAVELQWDLAHDFDYRNIYYATTPLIICTDTLKAFFADPREDSTEKDEDGKAIPGEVIDLSKYSFELTLPFGKFAFNGKDEDNKWECEDYYSIIDLAGNDNYLGEAASTASIYRPVSTVIDWAGNDKYISTKDDACSQGFGIMGVGILVDHDGDDEYRAHDNAQGGSYFGVGILHDEAGDDLFYGRNVVQAAGQFGVGNLLNYGGDDLYYCLGTSQGFGYVGGCGILFDTEGDDTYLGETGYEGEGWSRTGKPGDGWGLQTAATGGHDNDRNYTFVQGAGWGKRGDMGDGHGMGGGTGILLDCSGNDFYECGVYGQATGYWFGTGILNDIEGNDSYRGSFFVQSGTAHMGLTELLDESGDDTYQVFKAISNGGAHDFSNSWFIDKEGNDNYLMYNVYNEYDDDGNKTGETYKYAGGELCGGAITNSHGVHIDYGGDDNYELYTARSLGYSLQRTGPAGDSYRHWEWNVGLYINRGGNDTYTRTWEREKGVSEEWPEVANNACWKQVKQPGNLSLSIGFGLDVEEGYIPEVEW